MAESEEKLESLDESERREWKSWLKAQHSENYDHGIRSHHFMANRLENNGNSDRDDRGCDGSMASPTQWTWVWVDSRSWWWTGRPGVLQSMGLQRAGHDWATEMNWLMGPDAMILVFWMLSFKPTFSLSSFTFIKRLFSSRFLPWGWYHLHMWGCWYFSCQSWFQVMSHPVPHFTWCPQYIS